MDQLDELKGSAPTVLGTEQVRVLKAAVWAAPSLLNTRPWQLRFAADRVEVRADTARWVPAVDPLHRAAVISCGAALRNLTLAMRWLGLRPTVLEMPDRGNWLHVATVLARPASGAPAGVDDAALYQAVFRRHSYRGPLAAGQLPPAWRAQLHAAGQGTGVASRLIDQNDVPAVAAVLAAAVNIQRGDQHYQTDLLSWLRGHGPEHPVADGLVLARTPPAKAEVLARRLAHGQLTLVTTVDDGPRDWLRAGQALQSVWLTSTVLGLAGSVLSVVLEAPAVRGALAERLELVGFPQVFLRVGFAARSGAGGVVD